MPTRTEQKIWYLTNTALFRGSSEQFLKELERITRMEDVHAGHVVYGPEVNRGHVYILKKGSVNIFQVHNGKRITIDTLQPGDVFGDFGEHSEGVMADAPFAEARTGSTICVAQTRAFLRLLQRYPDVSLRIIQDLGMRLARAEAKIQDLALHSVSERLLHELLRLAQREGEEQTDVYTIPYPPTHEELARRIGSTRETVTKALSLLKEAGVVTTEGHTYALHKAAVRERERSHLHARAYVGPSEPHRT